MNASSTASTPHPSNNAEAPTADSTMTMLQVIMDALLITPTVLLMLSFGCSLHVKHIKDHFRVIVTAASTVPGLAFMPLNMWLFSRAWDGGSVLPYLQTFICLVTIPVPVATGMIVLRFSQSAAEWMSRVRYGGGKAAVESKWKSHTGTAWFLVPIGCSVFRSAIGMFHCTASQFPSQLVQRVPRRGVVYQRSDPIYRQYVDHLGELADKISHRWTGTQSLSITEQLDAGVRYLDIRVTARQGDREDLNVYFRNGPNIIIILKEIRRWMDLHPKEVILLDFRVVHKMSQAHHRYLLANMTDDVFRGRLLVYTGVVQAITLRNMWALDAQIIVFYPKECEQQHTCVWPNEYIGYLHPQAQSTRDMIDRLNTRYQHGRPPHVFFSWDGVMTTTNEYLANNLHSTLRDSLCRPATRALCNWVRNKDIRHGDMNIVVADFVETASFVDEVIRVNYELRELRKYDFERCVCNIL